jgi:hypothetical protein
MDALTRLARSQRNRLMEKTFPFWYKSGAARNGRAL